MRPIASANDSGQQSTRRSSVWIWVSNSSSGRLRSNTMTPVRRSSSIEWPRERSIASTRAHTSGSGPWSSIEGKPMARHSDSKIHQSGRRSKPGATIAGVYCTDGWSCRPMPVMLMSSRSYAPAAGRM